MQFQIKKKAIVVKSVFFIKFFENIEKLNFKIIEIIFYLACLDLELILLKSQFWAQKFSLKFLNEK